MGQGAGDDGERLGRRPTINDVARLAGVSKKTVSRVINGSPAVGADTRRKIEAVIAETGYAPDPQARGLAFRRAFLIGLLHDCAPAPSALDFQQGLLEGLQGSGFDLVVRLCDREHADLLADVRAFVEGRKLFGLVLPPSLSGDGEIVKIIDGLGCEHVRAPAVRADASALDVRKLGLQAAESLLSRAGGAPMAGA